MGKLYIVATPIGNLKDITLRALEVLKEVDFIACEDTRHTRKLLSHYDIEKPLISYFQHSKVAKLDKLISLLRGGKDIALVTDAGTPGISDPGGVLVDRITRETEGQIDIITIPGPSAVIAALSMSGFPTDEFTFYGFLPTKKGRQTKLKEIAEELKGKSKKKRVIVLYESPYRIKKLLGEILEFVGDREIVVCRELTKKFEEIYRRKTSEIVNRVKEKGEFVIVINDHESITNNVLNNTDIEEHEKATKNTLNTTKNIVDLLHKDLSYKIQGIAQKIRKDYGSGQKEAVYQKAFSEELGIADIPYEKEKNIEIFSPNTKKVVGTYRPDFVIDGKIILEIKAVNFLSKDKEDQLMNYLRSSKYELGYIINFGGSKLYCKKTIFTNDHKDFSVN